MNKLIVVLAFVFSALVVAQAVVPVAEVPSPAVSATSGSPASAEFTMPGARRVAWRVFRVADEAAVIAGTRSDPADGDAARRYSYSFSAPPGRYYVVAAVGLDSGDVKVLSGVVVVDPAPPPPPALSAPFWAVAVLDLPNLDSLPVPTRYAFQSTAIGPRVKALGGTWLKYDANDARHRGDAWMVAAHAAGIPAVVVVDSAGIVRRAGPLPPDEDSIIRLLSSMRKP